MPNTAKLVERQKAPLNTPSDIDPKAVKDISGALNALLADVFSLYLKTKNFHWHMSGPHFRDYHLLLDEHADQIFAMTDPIAERARAALRVLRDDRATHTANARRRGFALFASVSGGLFPGRSGLRRCGLG